MAENKPEARAREDGPGRAQDDTFVAKAQSAPGGAQDDASVSRARKDGAQEARIRAREAESRDEELIMRALAEHGLSRENDGRREMGFALRVGRGFSMSNELEILRAENEALHEEFNSLRRRLKESGARVNDLEDDLAGLRQSLRNKEKEIKELRAEKDKEIKELRAENEHLQEELHRLRKELEQVKKQHREDVERLQAVVVDLQDKDARRQWEYSVAEKVRKVAAKVTKKLDANTRDFVGPFFTKYLEEAEETRLSGEADESTTAKLQRARDATQKILREQFHMQMSFDEFVRFAEIKVTRNSDAHTVISDLAIVQNSPPDLRLAVQELLRVFNSFK